MEAFDDFTVSWRGALADWTPAVRVTSALIKLTDAGMTPTTPNRLAELVGLPVGETIALARRVSPHARIEDDNIYLDLNSSEESESRFRLRLGDRHLYTSGCAPDQYWVAFLVDEPLEIDARCGATGEPIRVVVSRNGVVEATPKTTVVALMDPSSVHAITDIESFDKEICAHQPFFASPVAGARWAEDHPNGKLFAVDAFFEFWRRELSSLIGDIMRQ